MLENAGTVWYCFCMDSNELDYLQKLRKDRNRKILSTIITFVLFCVLLNVLFLFVIFPVRVRSTDMLSEYEPNCLLFVAPVDFAEPLFFQRYTLDRGDVVYLAPAVEKETSWVKKTCVSFLRFFTFQQYAAESDAIVTESASIRRVVGLPGDTIYMKNYVVYIKPRNETHFLTEYELAAKPYETNFMSGTSHDQTMGVAGSMDRIVLGENEYFLLADNRISAVDSRLYGPVPSSRIKGKALLRYFPFETFRIL